ncbi:MAG: FAD-dependent oxidoreductase [Desulfobacterales bacterium]
MKRHSDVLVIGGGIIGLASAYYLAKEGKRVRLLEQDSVGAGASYGNCGLIFTSHLVPLCAPGTIRYEIKRMFRRNSPLYIKLPANLKRFVWFLNFARKCTAAHMTHAVQARANLLQSSKKLYERLIEDESIDCDWGRKGVLLIFKTKSEMQKYEQTNRRLKPFGLDAVPLSGDALLRLEPALRRDLHGAWFHKSDSHLRPDKLVTAWRKVLQNMGTVIEENCRVDTLVAEERRVRKAQTTNGDCTADEYVLAAGAWTPRIARRLKLNIPVQAGKGYSLTMARPPLCPEIPCYFYEKSVVATPWTSGFRLGGTMEFSGFNSDIDARRIQNLSSAANEYLKKPMGKTAVEQWAGMRPMVYDDLPIIDRAPNQHNLVIATGHGMSGISMATSTGKLVAEMISGSKPHIDPAAYRINRFYKLS